MGLWDRGHLANAKKRGNGAPVAAANGLGKSKGEWRSDPCAILVRSLRDPGVRSWREVRPSPKVRPGLPGPKDE
jgi:hypothetical protein